MQGSQHPSRSIPADSVAGAIRLMNLELDWNDIGRGGAFEELCHDLVRALLGTRGHEYEARSQEYQGDQGADGWLPQGEFEGLPAPVAFSYKSTGPESSDKEASKALAGAFSRENELEQLRHLNPRSVVLIANHSISTSHQDRLRERYMQSGFSRPRILDRRDLDLLLHDHLSVARKHFPSAGVWDFVATTRTDDEDGLRELLVEDPHAEGIPFTVHHPGLPKPWPGGQPRLLITGKPLAGKSFALAQVLARCQPVCEVIVLRSLDPGLWHGLSWLLSRLSPPGILVVDNLQDLVRHYGGVGLLYRLLESARAVPNLVGILLAYRSTDRANEDLDCQRYLFEKGFQEVDLDEPPRGFMEGVVDCICAANAISIDPELRAALLDSFIDWENTPGSAAAFLRPYRGRRLWAVPR